MLVMAHLTMPAVGAWPAVDRDERVCPSCVTGWERRDFTVYGESEDASRVRHALQKLTGRPWEWSRLHGGDGNTFSVSEGAIYVNRS
jgi:hypothetical protein